MNQSIKGILTKKNENPYTSISVKLIEGEGVVEISVRYIRPFTDSEKILLHELQEKYGDKPAFDVFDVWEHLIGVPTVYKGTVKIPIGDVDINMMPSKKNDLPEWYTKQGD